MTVEVGSEAPDFTLNDYNKQPVQLSSFRGDKPVLLVFYPFAFSRVCTGELCEVVDSLSTFASDDVQTLAVSCDPMFTLRAFAEQEGLTFPLLSDFWPHGEVARRYGVLDDEDGFALRGTFLIDRSGRIAWSEVRGIGQGRDFKAYREALATLRASQRDAVG
jgi:peroxiredoxin (alkyl hydroperoxide reductase subunit C)